MAQVLELRAERKVKKDSTFQWHGKTYEVVGRYLAGRTVTVISSLLDPSRLRLEHLGKPIEVFPVDVHQNARRRRGPRTSSTPDPKEVEAHHIRDGAAVARQPAHAVHDGEEHVVEENLDGAEGEREHGREPYQNPRRHSPEYELGSPGAAFCALPFKSTSVRVPNDGVL
jgi:hypothetical protein